MLSTDFSKKITIELDWTAFFCEQPQMKARTPRTQRRSLLSRNWNTSYSAGAGNGIRTRDPFLGKEVLYHWAIPASAKQNMRAEGLEPPRLKTLEPKPSVSTNSTTLAGKIHKQASQAGPWRNDNLWTCCWVSTIIIINLEFHWRFNWRWILGWPGASIIPC